MKFFPYLSLIIFITLSMFSPNGTRFRECKRAVVQDTIKGWAEVNFEAQGIQNKMAYADTANFMHQKIYPCARCFLRPEVAVALEEANRIAKDKGFTLVVYDCYRPYGYQKVMYDIVNDPRYVAPPGKGSNHNRGRAVDLSLADENGSLLDMGTPFDDFTAKSHYEAEGLSKEARRNRKALRSIMKKAGFTPYNNEWWHFDYKKQNYETADFRWDCNG
ncbi:D-alanyl-D-alanine dipeptidase [Flavobacterium sp. DG1-102-2]|uniref:D-alanyl-D-alanine dipeptidase n=1 Tax=Flavobacterium sp. DG1-102-2 TaxID=3081663 RepID=UPI00294A15AE|nr:D-alanyl-D-alanine dipeptidase [Flavobacterium sp. DG1-102-2]MDV6168448.1 D-alanyl-D-alanine dipeptidase [Flavobacterium sp. DG1-102-2]